MLRQAVCGGFIIAALLAGGAAGAETIKLGDVTLTIPTGWQRQEPRVEIIEHEYAIPSGQEGVTNGRMTVSRAGGSVEANIERWYGQFTQPDGKATKDVAQVDKKEVAGRTVHIVDISGTYADARGPFAPAVQRKDYRMLAAIIPTPQGNYFLKFYGPKAVIAKQAAAFTGMVLAIK